MSSLTVNRSQLAQNMLQTAWTARPHDVKNHALQWGTAVEPLFYQYHGLGNVSFDSRKIGTRLPEYLAEVQKQTQGIWSDDNARYSKPFGQLVWDQQYNMLLILFASLVGDNRYTEAKPDSCIRGTDCTDVTEAACEYADAALSFSNLANIHGSRLENAVKIALGLIEDYEAVGYQLTNHDHFMNATMAFHDEMNRINGWGTNDHYVRHYGAHIFSDPYEKLMQPIKERNILFMLAVYAAYQAGKNPSRASSQSTV